MALQSTLEDPSSYNFLPDWPAGPLDEYRQKADFSWKKMKVFLEGEDIAKFKVGVFDTLAQDPLFQRKPWDERSRDEERKLTFLRMKRLIEYNFVNEESFIRNPNLAPAMGQCTGQFDWSLCVKKFLSYEYFIGNARSGGSAKQNQFMEDIKQFKALGALSITELAHGSNSKGLRTTATFDARTQQFVMNTPDLEATKVWSGNLGQNATHAVIFAQLYTPDGQCHGLHSFLVPVRDPNTLLPYPGVKVGDMGPKIGLNGIDNGFMQFSNYRISKDALMNRHADVTPEGNYVTTLKKDKNHGVTLGILSLGRVSIIMNCYTNLQTAVTIAVRYSLMRKQFGPPDSPEWAVMEYQTQQWRLMPYIATSYVIQIFSTLFFTDYINFFISVAYGGLPPEQSAGMGAEIHCLSSAGKAVCGWLARDGIQESREACGGHGYLKASRFGEIRDDHDANNTYEGDNTVLLQQTSNYLIKLLQQKREGKSIKSDFGTTDYLNEMDSILQFRLVGDISNPQSIMDSYKFLVCWLLKKSDEKLSRLLKSSGDNLFVARSQSQVYYLRSLSIAYFECCVIDRYFKLLSSGDVPQDLLPVLNQLGLLFSLWSLEKHAATLFEAGYFSEVANQNPLTRMRESILTLCAQIKTNAIALVDVFAPPDYVLNSCLGYADGKIYEHIFDALQNSAKSYERPSWYTEFTENKPKLEQERLNFLSKL